ncbi:MAG TPA: AI-2E family transporter [Myxococcaceae bacterium]|nr:AI-2E family transporter [Myxococcaceae bacterium]
MPDAQPLPFRRRATVLVLLWVTLAVLPILFPAAILPFVGSALIAYLVAPILDWLTGQRVFGRVIARWVAILLLYAVFFLLIYLFIIAIVPQLYRELVRITSNALSFARSLTPDRVQELAQQMEGWLNSHGVPVALSSRSLEGADAAEAYTGRPSWSLSMDLERLIHDVAARFSSAATANVTRLVNFTRELVTGVFKGVFTLFLMLMVAAFLSIDAARIRTYFRSLVPPEWASDASALVRRIDRGLAGVVRGQVTICIVNGVLTFTGLVLFGVKFAFLLATIATFFSLIPIFGTIISSVPIVIMALAQNWRAGFGMLFWIIGIHALEAYFLNPKIMGNAARMHPVVVVFALIAGERTYGLLGALFAVPVAAVVVACFEFLRRKAQPVPMDLQGI